MKRVSAAILVVFFFCSAAPAAEDGGWRSLFNGKDLSGWKVPEGDGGHWKVIDGVIDYDAQSEAKGDKNLWTEESFGDCILEIEWRIKEVHGLYPVPTVLPDGSLKKGPDGKPIITPTPNADSGVFVRGHPKGQINIWCWPIGSGEIYGYRTDPKVSAEVRAACVPKVAADKPVGQWNRFVITVRGDRLSVELNGKKVIDNVQLSEMPATGPIGLQHHGGIDKKTGQYGPASSLMQFRNIRVKPL